MASLVLSLGAEEDYKIYTGVALGIDNIYQAANIEISGLRQTKSRETRWQWNSAALQAIITNITPRNEVNASHQNTLDGDIYICVYGDKLGTMTVSGTAFNVIASDYYRDWKTGIRVSEVDPDLNRRAPRPVENLMDINMEPGISRVMQFYNAIKLSSQSGKTVVNMSKNGIFSGYSVSWQVSAYNEEYDTFDFSFDFWIPPAYRAKRKKAAK